jgi:hypothetical protein
MSNPTTTPSNPWLQLAVEALEFIKQEPPEVQASLRRMERRTYPETTRALAELEGEQHENG